MKKNLPEVIFSSSLPAKSREIRELVTAGKLRKLLPRVYTSNMEGSVEKIVSRNLYPILGKLYPEAIISHRSALDGGPMGGHLFLTYTYNRNIELPGYTIHLLKGPQERGGITPMTGGLFMSSEARALLENLQISRGRGTSKTLKRSPLEERLERLCSVRGEGALNKIRDEAGELATKLQMQREFKILEGIIGAILSTRPASGLISRQARARSEGTPYDPGRLELFSGLLSYLAQNQLPAREETRRSESEMATFSFFEAYFSNYIEGTEFALEEAYDIVFRDKIPSERPNDAHDILGTFRVLSNQQEMIKPPASPEALVALLKSRHFEVMKARSEVSPGEFKLKANRAGSTHFVEPELVEGTLLKGFEMARAVEQGLARSLFIMFVIAEVHPFVDGNGRIARIMMNGELAQLGLSRIMVPAVMRDDYLRGLRKLSRTGEADAYVEIMDYLQAFSAALSMPSYDEASAVLKSCNAFAEPDDAHLRMPRDF